MLGRRADRLSGWEGPGKSGKHGVGQGIQGGEFKAFGERGRGDQVVAEADPEIRPDLEARETGVWSGEQDAVSSAMVPNALPSCSTLANSLTRTEISRARDLGLFLRPPGVHAGRPQHTAVAWLASFSRQVQTAQVSADDLAADRVPSCKQRSYERWISPEPAAIPPDPRRSDETLRPILTERDQ